MNDPVPRKILRLPRRAAPLQPDPLSGADVQDADGGSEHDGQTGTPADPDSVKRQKAQADAALANVRDGYK